MTPAIRVLSLPEVETLVDWAAAEGWNPGFGDAQAFRAADPEGFLGAFVDGAMAAGIAAVAYGNAFGFVGLYVCRPDQRGKGLGKAVWDAGMARLAGRTVGLDGVPAQQANYRSMGFRPAYDTLRHVGRPEPAARRQFGPQSGRQSIEPYEPTAREALMLLDAACFPARRTPFLESWLREPRTVLVARRNGEVIGWGARRRCKSGCKIGPLFARDGEAAGALFFALASGAGAVSIDVPEGQSAFRRMLEGAGMVPGFTTSRMYRGAAPQVRSDWVFGVTTLELG